MGRRPKISDLRVSVEEHSSDAGFIELLLNFVFLRSRRQVYGALTLRGPNDRDKTSWLVIRLLKEKTRRSVQLLGSFKQELTAHTLLALLVSRHIRCVDA